MKKELTKMKDLDRFREKSNYLRNQKKEFGLWKTFKKNSMKLITFQNY